MTPPRTFASVQYLRVLAAAAVILLHGLSQLQRFQPSLQYREWGAVAVDVFFVISGFVIWHMTMAQPVGPLEYARRRLVRVVPFYWLMTTVVVAVMMLAPSLLTSSRFDGPHVLASYLFLPALHPVLHGEIAPVIVPGWTLTYEVAFYALMGLALLLPLRFRAPAVIGAIVGIALLPAFVASTSPLFIFYTQPIVLEFASGVLIGSLLWSGFRLPAPLALGMIAAGLAAAILLPSPSHVVPGVGLYRFMLTREIEYLIPAFAIVGGAVFFDAARPSIRKSKTLLAIGEATYAIYIVHVLVLPAATRAWRVTGLAHDARWNAIYLALALTAAIMVGIAIHRFVEVPLHRFFDRLTRNRSARAGAVAAAA